jgi:hypothetical protein
MKRFRTFFCCRRPNPDGRKVGLIGVAYKIVDKTMPGCRGSVVGRSDL